MSRTDGHEPYWVSEERYGVLTHYHETGECNLSAGPRYRHRWYFGCRHELSDHDHHKYCGNDHSVWEKASHEAAKRANRREVKLALMRGDWESAELDAWDRFRYYD